MKRLLSLVIIALMALPIMAQKNVYKFSVKDGNEKTIKLKEYKGKVLLIVNTATKCGFTPQYEALQKLYDTYKDRGFVILDFPCNQFGAQAPGSLKDIHSFCTSTYGITFPQFAKIVVNGKNESPCTLTLRRNSLLKVSIRPLRLVNTLMKSLRQTTLTMQKTLVSSGTSRSSSLIEMVTS